jgi:outer membrane protein with beta-barrel domain
MKKLMICILCLASIPCFAQFRLGVQGSLSSLNFWQTDGYTGLPSQEFTWQMNGFRAGVFGEYDLGYSGLELVPSLNYALNGAHIGQSLGFPSDPNLIYDFSDTRVKVYSLSLPVNLEYGFRVSPKFKVFGGAGLYISKNLSGTEKGNYSVDSINNTVYGYTFRRTNNLKFNNNQSNYVLGQSNVSPIDFGLDILLGFQYKKLQISGSYNRGFVKEYHTSYVNMGNQFWNFTVGYVLWGHDRKPKL